MAMIRAGWGNPGSAFMAAFTSVFCPGASNAELENLVEIQLASTSPENAARIRRAIDEYDVTAYLDRVKAPTLVIHASKDALHPVSQGRLIASSIPGAEFLQVDSRNHIYLPSDPAWAQIVDAQIAFLDRHLEP
jgi:pimeloyl-ACP methyl ester carboxylesterase